MARNICLLVILAQIGCGSNPPLDKDVQANLQAQAAEVGQAMMEHNHARMADLTHPFLVNQLGGKEQFIKTLTGAMEEMKREGVEIIKVTMETPTGGVKEAGEIYAIVPFKLDMKIRAKMGTQPSYLLGYSKDEGKTFVFVDGAGIGADRAKAKQVLPKLPSSLSLPAPQQTIWK